MCCREDPGAEQGTGRLGANSYFHGTADAGSTALARAFRSVRGGESDVVLAGGFDDAASWWLLSKVGHGGADHPQ